MAVEAGHIVCTQTFLALIIFKTKTNVLNNVFNFNSPRLFCYRTTPKAPQVGG